MNTNMKNTKRNKISINLAIFNKKNDGWGAYSYTEAEDALRVNVKPDFDSTVQEQLMYAVDNSGIVFAWEKARLHLSVE